MDAAGTAHNLPALHSRVASGRDRVVRCRAVSWGDSMSALLVMVGALLFIASGLVALVPSAKKFAAAVHVVGAITGLTGCALAFRGAAQTLTLPWAIPAGAIAIRLDALSAFFPAPGVLLPGPGAIYAEAYSPSA